MAVSVTATAAIVAATAATSTKLAPDILEALPPCGGASSFQAMPVTIDVPAGRTGAPGTFAPHAPERRRKAVPVIKSPHSRQALLALALLAAGIVHAQPPARAGRPAIGHLYGRVLDAQTRTPAEFAAVTVLAADRDSVLGGGLVQGNGDFSVDRLPTGPLRLRVAFMGYKTLEQRVALTPDAPEKDLGNLLLEPDQVVLQEAEVVRDKATTMMQVDRRVFNVEKDLSAQGGTAVDVVKNVPGLSVDVDGNVQLRGGNPLVLIDGKPTTLALEDIPAGEIERIEVITNPSVAFDANTSGGIVNVVLKKSTKPGYYGNVQLGAGTNDRYQAGLNLNVREGRWGFNLSYNYNTAGNRTDARTDREDRLNGATVGRFHQTTAASGTRLGHGGRIGADLRIDNRNTLTFAQSARWRNMESDDRQDFTSTAATDTWGTQRNTEDNRNLSLTSQLGFRRTSPKQGKEWTADLTYNRWDRNSEAGYATNTFTSDGQLPTSPRLQENQGGSDLDQFTLQFDAVDPLSERDRIEWGAKADLTNDHTWLDVALTMPGAGTRPDTALSNDYDITNRINAAYFNWSHKLTAHWSMQGGLRFEQSWYDITMRGKGERFGYRYPDGTKDLMKALFPAVYFSRKWDGSRRELQVNFSRKIDRPRFWQVTPFVMNSDSRNVRIGNPGLAPELSSLAEVNHLLPFLHGKATWFTSVFGKYTQDVIVSYSTPLASDTTLLLTTFVNGDHSVSAGWENMVKLEPAKGPQITLSGTVQYVDVGLGADAGELRRQGVNWSAKAMVNYRLRKDLVVQVNGEYEGPRVQPQGRTLDQYGVDASVNYDLAKNLSLVAAVNDLFFTRRWGNVVDTPYLYQESYRRRDMRNFRVTLTWKFGQQDASLFRRRQQPTREAGGGEEGF